VTEEERGSVRETQEVERYGRLERKGREKNRGVRCENDSCRERE
jgi:hypothetical protein